MPGVEKENVEISVKDRIVTIEGRIDFQKYAGMNPVYTEYNIGNSIEDFLFQIKSMPPNSS